MKQFISGFATCAVICALLFMGSSAIADSPIKLFIDGEIINAMSAANYQRSSDGSRPFRC